MAEYQYTNHKTKRKKNGKRQSQLKHRYVWEQYNGEIPKGYVIHHINGNKKDNRIENLKLMKFSDHIKLHKDEELKCKEL